MADEIQQYEYQLSQVKIALSADPSNAELQGLESELQELIDLTKAAYAPPPPPPSAPAPSSSLSSAKVAASSSTSAPASSSKSTPVESNSSTTTGVEPPVTASQFKVSDFVLAKYTDGSFYPAKILSQSGPAGNPIYTVLYTSYASSPPSTIPLSSLKPLPASQKRKAEEKFKEENEKERKKVKNEKWKEIKKVKNEEQIKKQSSWQAFGQKAKKKGVKVAGLDGSSIFKTPDAVNGKVGVVGSGRGMTEYSSREKHKFAPKDDE
ncbi:Splicing factor SPF30 [Phaffia rhodozyma]|uniref:Splicing factor SPF30 n=1 Tax=Phaffia rhodozyma TaxID=264483 RepID=A0A0F7SEP9_PHARH|nr:Splicing factor SPF30 [Phaffia rhodozyma]